MKRTHKEKGKTITRAFFEILAVGTVMTLVGLISQGRTAPRLLKSFARFGSWRIKLMLKRLKIQGLIVYDEEDEYSPILLTEKGFVRVTKGKLRDMRGKRWDHLWRLVLFDIPNRKGIRGSFQKLLRQTGFFQVQKSVYAYPFECKDDILRLASSLHASSYVVVCTTPDLGLKEKEARRFYFQRRNA